MEQAWRCFCAAPVPLPSDLDWNNLAPTGRFESGVATATVVPEWGCGPWIGIVFDTRSPNTQGNDERPAMRYSLDTLRIQTEGDDWWIAPNAVVIGNVLLK